MSQAADTRSFGRKLLERVVTTFAIYNVLAISIGAGLVVTAVILGAIAAAFATTDTSEITESKVIYGSGSYQLLSIPINGVIVGTSDEMGGDLFGSLGGMTAGYDVKDQLYKAAEADFVAGVILEINSPGGTIYGAHAIADGVSYYREKTKRPVYAHISGMGASGGYWAAAAADKVVGDYGSLIGSIGVIMGPFQYYDGLVAQDGGILSGGVVTQNGIESFYITAGTGKDAGSPYRRLTPEELAVFQKSINLEYTQFVDHVSRSRGIPMTTIRDIVGAHAYDPTTAKELKLINSVGSKQAAYAQLAKAANVENDYQVVQDKPIPGFVETLLGAKKPQSTTPTSQLPLCQGRSVLAYQGDLQSICSQ